MRSRSSRAALAMGRAGKTSRMRSNTSGRTTFISAFLGTAYGFLSRGCPRNCGFCIVSGKEGRRSVKVADLSEFWRGEDEIKLLDPNLLACPDHEALLEQLAASRALVDFTQGLDIRLTNPDNIALLNKVRTKAVHFAWDNPEEDLTEHFRRFVAHTAIRSDGTGGCMY